MSLAITRVSQRMHKHSKYFLIEVKDLQIMLVIRTGNDYDKAILVEYDEKGEFHGIQQVLEICDGGPWRNDREQ